MRCVLLSILLLTVGCHGGRDARLELENKQLRTKLEEKNLEFQEKCAKQARERFNSDWRGEGDLTNHYNTDLNRCFMDVITVKLGPTETIRRYLLDAFEGTTYGSYRFAFGTYNTGPQASMEDCSVHLPSGENKKCSSENEFAALIKPYMQYGH